MQNEIQTTNQNGLAIIANPAQLIYLVEKKCELSTASFLKENYSNNKIRLLKSHEIYEDTIAMMLTKILALSGIKGEVGEINVKDINRFILTACADLTLEDLYKAFELERYLVYSEKTQHYNLFDTNYFVAVIKKYRIWKLTEIKTLNIEPDKKKVEISEDDKIQTRNEYLKVVFDEINQKGNSSEAYHLYKDLEVKINALDESKKQLYKEQLRIYEVEEKAFIRNKFGIDANSHLMSLSLSLISKTPLNIVLNRCMSILVSKYLSKYKDDFNQFKKEIQDEN
jgi:hypothetical protein